MNDVGTTFPTMEQMLAVSKRMAEEPPSSSPAHLIVHPTLNDPVGQFIKTLYPKARVENGRLILGKRARP